MIGKEFGQFIASERKRKGVTQKELAKILKVTDRAVSNWERGTNYPDITMLTSLAEVLGVSVIELLKGQRLNSDNITKEKVDDYLIESMTYSKAVSRKRFEMTLGKATIMIILLLFVSYGFVSVFFPTALLNYKGWKTVEINQMGTIKVPESWVIDQKDGFWIATDNPITQTHTVIMEEVVRTNRWTNTYDPVKLKAGENMWSQLFMFTKRERYGNLSELRTGYIDSEWTIPLYTLHLYGRKGEWSSLRILDQTIDHRMAYKIIISYKAK
jgi:transcriptional regulator with XRE-family HTH domain